MELPKRKILRLQGYDYSQNGAYFITICTHNREHLLSQITVGGGVLDTPKSGVLDTPKSGVLDTPKSELSNIGEIAEKHIISISKTYENISIDNYVIMPNHIHMIIIINGENGTSRVIENGTSRTPSPTMAVNAVIPRVISTYKRFTNKECGFGIWQRSYHDHIIRNEQEYIKIREYINTNPYKWDSDCYF